MKDTPNKDPFLSNLLRQSATEEPSADFTQRLMSAIQQSETSIAKPESFLSRYKYWFITLTIIILTVFIFNFSSFLIGNEQIQILQKFINPYINIFRSLISLLKNQPIISIIIVALTGLLLIDKLLSRLFHQNIQHS